MIQDDNSIPLLTEVIPMTPQVLPEQTLASPVAWQSQPGQFDQSGQFGQSGQYDQSGQSGQYQQPGPDYGAAPYPGAFHTDPSTASYQAPLPAAAPVLSFSAEHASHVEQEIRENVLQRLLAQADTVLQQHLQDQLAVVLDNLADILTQRVKDSLRQALAETVTQAVAEEMARYTSSKN